MTIFRIYSNVINMNNDYEPKQLYTLTGSEQVRAYAHPARMEILQMLAKERRTVSGVAKEMKVHPANITHHFKLLEKTGLILLVEKRDTGRNLEKYYRAAAHHYIVQMQESPASEKKAAVLSILRDDLSAALDGAARHDGKPLMGLMKSARLQPDQVAALFEAMEKLIASFSEGHSPEGYPYTLNISLYPIDTMPPDEREEIIIT